MTGIDSSRPFPRPRTAPSAAIGLLASLVLVSAVAPGPAGASGTPAPTTGSPTAREEAAPAGGGDPQLLRSEAGAALELGDREESERIYRSILESSPQDLEALLGLATLYEQAGKLAYAHSLLMRAFQVTPQDVRIRDRLDRVARTLRETFAGEIDRLEAEDRHAETIPLYKKLLALNEGDHYAYYRMGRALLAAGEPRQAVAAFEKALELEPAIEAYRNARSEAEAAIRGDDLADLEDRAQVLYARGDPDRARLLLDEILRIDPENRWAKQVLERGETRGAPADTSAVGAVEKGLWLPDLRSIAAAVGRFLARAGPALLVPLREPLVYLAVGLFCLIYLSIRLPRALVRSGRRGALSGSLRQYRLRDVFSFLHDLDKTGVVIAWRRGTRAQIVFEQGEIVCAQTRRNEGTEAVKELLEWTEGGFYVKKGSKVYRRNVDQPFTFLLMDHPDLGIPGETSPTDQDQPRSHMMELLEDPSHDS